MVQLGKQVPRSCAPHLKMEEQTSRRITNATFSALRSNRRGIKFKMIRQGQTIDPISTKWKGTKRDGEKQQNRPGPFLYSLHPKKKKCGPDKKKKGENSETKVRFGNGSEPEKDPKLYISLSSGVVSFFFPLSATTTPTNEDTIDRLRHRVYPSSCPHSENLYHGGNVAPDNQDSLDQLE